MHEHLLLILGMAVVTYIPRVVPLLLLSSKELNPTLMRWLEMIPPAVLAALLAPGLFLQNGPDETRVIFFSMDNVFLLAAIPSFIAGWVTRSFFGTGAVGMAAVAALRYCYAV
jgi:branched-subunit amino acid transport protein